jgi:hypothetical protein
VTPAESIAAGLRNQAEGLCWLEAAAELVIAQDWLQRADFTSRCLTTVRGLTGSRPMAAIDWPTVITALSTGQIPCSGGERRMLCLTASLAEGIPVDLREALTGIDEHNLGLLIDAMRHATGQRRR